ncbi:MAG: peptidase S1 [Proteobacteria bacterium]|nr:peptidase S1 [Pseudomonadota bacterium]
MLAVAAVIATLGAAPASAQHVNLQPTYGTITLRTGFEPDPTVVAVQSGGNINANTINSSCAGFIADAPDVRLQFTAGSLPLIISVASQSDTTLIVNGPDGRWYCDDDGGQNMNPSLRFDHAASGQYDIWIGTYGASSLQNAQLNVSELTSQ